MRLMWIKKLLNWLLSLLPNRDWALKRHDFSFYLENRSLLINSAIYLDLKIQLPSAWQLNNLSIHPGFHSLRTNSQTQFFFYSGHFFSITFFDSFFFKRAFNSNYWDDCFCLRCLLRITCQHDAVALLWLNALGLKSISNEALSIDTSI